MNLKNFFQDMKESVLDPIHQELSPDLWHKNKKIKATVKKFIIDKLNEWLSLYTKKKPKKIYIAGSMTGYQYTDYSDIDVNVIIDLPDDKIKHLASLLPNGELLPGTQHPVNYYITNTFKLSKSGSVYDLLNNRWVVRPQKQNTNIHYKAVLEITLSWMRKIDLDINELKRDVMEYKLYHHFYNEKDLELDRDEIEQYLQQKKSEIQSDIDTIHITYYLIKKFRKEPFEKEDYKFDFLTQEDEIDANYTINNLIYKTLERFGYLEIMHKYSKLDFKDALEEF